VSLGLGRERRQQADGDPKERDVEERIEMSGHSGIVVPLSDLTNRELVKRLYQRYYIEGIGSAGQGSQLLSSHWKDRSSKFDVLMEDDAALSLTSVGMGLTMSTSPLQNCPTEELDKVAMSFDVVTNVGSMQEMNYATIERYFSFLRRRCKPGNLFYCCNRELKRLIGGEVIEFKKYPWWPADRHLVDEVCPWYRYQLLTRRSAKLLGIPIPRASNIISRFFIGLRFWRQKESRSKGGSRLV
jgi:hypothetical protein